MPEKKERKSGYGGSRPGSGRPKGSPNIKPKKDKKYLHVYISKEACGMLDAYLKKTGQKRVDVLEQMIRIFCTKESI